MKKWTKNLVIMASVLVVLGIVLCVVGIMAGGAEETTDFLKDHYRKGNEVRSEAAGDTAGSDHGQSQKIEASEGDEVVYAAKDLRGLHVEAAAAKLENQEITIELPKDFKFQEVDISAGASMFIIEKLLADSVDIEIGAGKAQVKLIEALEAEFEIGAGEILVEEGCVKDCSADIGVGNFEYQGSITRECSVECDMGNAEIDIVDADKTDYNYEIEVGAGAVRIGDESFGGLASEKTINHHAERYMDIECSVGSVKIEF